MADRSSVLVVGAGIAGIRASLDLAESGVRVYLVDFSPNMGGTLVQLDKWFPDNHCGMCKVLPIFARDESSQYCLRKGLVHPRIEFIPRGWVNSVEGEAAGGFSVTVQTAPTGVNHDLCIGCGLCVESCPVEVPNEFDHGLSNRKAIYLSNPWMPTSSYAIDWDACTKCNTCVERCPCNAIDLSALDSIRELQVGAIVISTGFGGFDASSASQYGYQRYPNVLTSIDLERYLSPGGPTHGNLVRPSDKKTPQSIGFLQCVGSRDYKRNYCSAACCMYALKEAMLVKTSYPDIDVEIFFMDLRAFGKGYHRYYDQAREMGIKFTRCRVPVVRQDFKTNDLLVNTAGEDGALVQRRFDLIVLSVGQVPSPAFEKLADTIGIELNQSKFCGIQEFLPVQSSKQGVFVCGSASGPKDIADTLVESSAAADRALRFVVQEAIDKSDHRVHDFDSNEEDIRTVVLLCQCGEDVSSVIDMGRLAEAVKFMPSVVSVEALPDLYNRDEIQIVNSIIAEHKANRIVLAAGNPFVTRKLISMLEVDPFLVQVVNMREEIAWPSKDNPKLATDKAISMLSMAIERLRSQEPVPISSIRPKKSVLVIGGGIAGMSCAVAIAERGHEVHLIERNAGLGGNVRDVSFTVQGNDVQTLLSETIQQVENSPNIHVHREVDVRRVDGYVGAFTVDFEDKEGLMSSIEVGAIVVATGGELFEPEEYLYTQNDQVVTQKVFEQKIVGGELDNADSVAVIQCVGSRDQDRPYCSRICCAGTLKNVLRLKERNPGVEVVVFYRDMMSYGFLEEYYTLAREHGVIFIQYDLENKPQVKVEGNKLVVRAKDPGLQSELVIEPDMLALSAAIVPQDHSGLANILDVGLTDDGFFQEAEVKFRPVDFLKDGIFVCGLAHSPRSIKESLAQAQAVALRVSAILQREEIYSGHMVSEVIERRCVGCEVCIEVCPYGARTKDPDTRVVVVREAICQGCGACAVACPSGAAKIRGFSDSQVLSMMDAAI
ncbi:MAG: FAD-dependent oxidoreductase [Chloroflexota bacterium]|nr:FAD-dependent oxidoreductase [Chloroflexota bacterium]